MKQNKTRADAFERVTDCRMGSFVDASPEFLECLRSMVLSFASEIGEELARKDKAAARAAAAREW